MKDGSGILASIEGISGTGKSYFVSKLRNELQDIPARFLPELSDRTGDGMDRKIIAALRQTNDQFLRTGLPRTETFLLLALKIFDYENTIANSLKRGEMVIEDRSIDSIAVYQSIMLCSNNGDQMLKTANEIYELVSHWRQPPDITFLIQDDFQTAVRRAETRQKRPFTSDELGILRRASNLYSEYATFHKQRIVPLDRRRMNDARILDEMKQSLLARS